MDAGHRHQHASEDDRTNRFLSPLGDGHMSVRERAASQPPRASGSPATPTPVPSPYTPRTPSGLNPHPVMPQSVPTRSTSFSGGGYGGGGNAPTVQRGFASTYEDDEFDGYDGYDEGRGRPAGALDITRSRSQSLVPTRPGPIGSPFRTSIWEAQGSTASSYADPGPARYASELRPPAASRYGGGGLNASSFARSPPQGDVSNISPFVRDVSSILLDDGSAFRELWAMPDGGASGTTSRRHSVSVVQPRRELGFGAPELDAGAPGGYGRWAGAGGFDDDELAADLGMLALNDGPGAYGHQRQRSTDPAHGRSPTAGSYGLTLSGGGGGFPGALGSPGGGGRYARPYARRGSDAGPPPPPVALADVGKGVPLSAVPASWPLYIVEFKAGRTDLYYCTHPALELRVGDLVLVEADRGKDLGRVANDSISHREVEAFQQQQLARAGWGADGAAPAPPQPQGKEINPKMIYGKASANDAQYVLVSLGCSAVFSPHHRVLMSKRQEEEKALQLCQAKVRQKKLPMEVVDAEYQWSVLVPLVFLLGCSLPVRDRRKLTFYFVAEKRIDFRELVRELFRSVIAPFDSSYRVLIQL
jgi:hypothetical protein